jgi:membrane associated rhomboid family serine protease
MFMNKKGQFFPYSDTAPRKRFPIITVSLIVLNVVVFVWSLTDYENIISKYGFVPASFSFLTLFTSMFLHGGFDHIFGNMWYLWIFGDNVEDSLGKVKFVLLYFLSGISAAFLQYITDPSSTIPSIGASGAISGVLGSYILLFPQEKVLTNIQYTFVRIPAYIVIGFWFVLQLLFGAMSLAGYSGSNVAFWAHVSGFVAGFLLTKILLKLRIID